MRLGYFGGSFDPVHFGHLALARAAVLGGLVDQVVFLPAGIPPHKRRRVMTDGAIRVQMLEAAIAGEAAFTIDRREIADTSPSWTVKTLESVHAERPADTLKFMIGMDSLRDLRSWHRIERIAELATFVVARRPGTDTDEARTRAAAIPGMRIEFLDAAPVDCSSSEIRERVKAGRSIDDLCPEPVRAIIAARGLYRER